MTPSRSNSSPIIHSSLTSSRTDQLVDPPLPSSPATSKNISPAPLQRSPPSYLPPALRSLAAALAGGATVASLPLLSLLPSPLLALSSQPLGGFNLEGPGSVLQALAVLAVIVTVHECGHFFAARSLGMRVTKFSIGFGPTLWGFTGEKDGVEYALRAFPLGGYVGFPDDDPDSDIPADDPDLLRNRPLLERAAVISAGVVANAVFAYALLFTQARGSSPDHHNRTLLCCLFQRDVLIVLENARVLFLSYRRCTNDCADAMFKCLSDGMPTPLPSPLSFSPAR